MGAGEASATKAQGEHGEHLLILVEEAAGANPAVMVAYQNTLAGPHNYMVAVGNPDHEEDPLHEWCLQKNVEHIRISALDHPNVVRKDPTFIIGACDSGSIADLAARYEHAPAMYKSRVKGISPQIAHGVALQFNAADHLEEWDRDSIRHAVGVARWPVYIGVDPGDRGWAAMFGLVDPHGRMHVVCELFSQQEVLGERMDLLLGVLGDFGCDRPKAAWYDSAAAAQGREMNRILREIGAGWAFGPSLKRVVKGGERVAEAYVSGFVTRTNQLLYRKALLFATDLDPGPWRRGVSAASAGRPMTGSRLIWELKRWRYPDRRPGQVSRRNPDDSTADDAHAIAALRYLVMGWWGQRAQTTEQIEKRELVKAQIRRGVPHEMRGLPDDEFDERGNRIRDRRFERMCILEARRQRSEQRGRGGWGINKGF